MDQDAREQQLRERIAARGSLLIAFSGGVDSSLLSAIAREVLGDRCRAVFLESPLVPRSAMRDARETAAALGIPLEVIPLPVMELESFPANPPDRCYHCKRLSARVLKERARELGIACVADGTSASDLGGHRPGLRAGREEGIAHPLMEAGITKEDIRAIARRMGYAFWSRPSAACLASRIPYGEELSIVKLRMIEDAEEVLHALGFTQVRVRLHGELARIEVMPGEMERLWKEREGILESLQEMGFAYVTIDLAGYRSGSMDEVL
ncbi:MAG: ATP-dependent sacrificial sulfur transferase LarE [Methanomicrobiales archaeon]|nr:ATP-dependent sacrificial sulfur transferase LarE [Methanomicrobiales archaeon]